MENLFENTTTLDKKTYYELSKFNYKLSRSKSLLIICVLSGLSMLTIYSNSSNADDSGIDVLSVLPLLIVFAIFMYFLYFTDFFWKRAFNKLIQTDKRMQAVLIASYTFKEEELDYSIGAGSGSLTYGMLHKVYESDAYFYFFINVQQAYVVQKDGFTLGTSEQLRSFLMRKMGKKFYNKTKKKRY